MSINVTVHGNPISIKRGKMVALDKDNKEFEVRRKIRIQQVRQQSNKIAEDVRNKVKREKEKQLGKCNLESNIAHAESQHRKLNCLSQQLGRSCGDFGEAYRNAEKEPDENEVIHNLNEQNRRIADIRGKCAELEQQEKRDIENYLSNQHNNNLKLARYIEDLRSKLVSDLPKQQKRKRKINIRNIEINGEKIDEDLDDISDISVEITEPEEERSQESITKVDEATSCKSNEKVDVGVDIDLISKKSSKASKSSTKVDDSAPCAPEVPCRKIWNELNSPPTSPKAQRSSASSNKENIIAQSPSKSSKTDNARSRSESREGSENAKRITIVSDNTINENTRTSRKSGTRLGVDDDDDKKWYAEFMRHKGGSDMTCNKLPLYHPVLTSIDSDKIIKKCKQQSPERVYPIKKTLASDKKTKINRAQFQNDKFETVTPIKVKQKKKRKKLKLKESLHDANYIQPTYVDYESNVLNVCPSYQLPRVPTTCIRSESPDLQASTVKYYDRFKKFAKDECQPTYVQKISQSDLRVIEDNDSEDNQRSCLRKIQRAKERGARALEKVKIQRDYEKLLHELPILEKQERLANIRNKASLHMTDERLREYERKKQNLLENKYESMQAKADLFNRPCITLKSIRKSPPKTVTIPLKNLDLSFEPCYNVDCTETSSETKRSAPTCINVQQMSPVPPKKSGSVNKKVCLDQEMSSGANVESIGRVCPKLCKRSPKSSRSNQKVCSASPKSSRSNQRVCSDSPKSSRINKVIKKVCIESEKSSKPPCDPQTSESSQIPCGSQNSSESYDESEKIAELLKRINKQRELLIKEAVNMKSLRHLKDILNEEELINIICKCPPSQKRFVEVATSPLVICKTSQTKRGAVTSSSDSSFECKPKMKPKPKKLKIYLREEGTQTSPCICKTPVVKRVSSHKLLKKSTSRLCNTKPVTKSTSCPCKKSCECLCKKGESCLCSKISTNTETTKQSSSKSSSDKVEIIIRAGDQVKINPIIEEDDKKDVIIRIKDQNVKNKNDISTSTSYLSPPICQNYPPMERRSSELEKILNYPPNCLDVRREMERRSSEMKAKTCSGIDRPSNKQLLQPQRQQTNLDHLVKEENGQKQVNPRLVKYITRLLNMSRQSIEELTVSSVSDISTPQDSVIQCASNMAKEKLLTVMEHFHLSADDIKNMCSTSSTLTDNDSLKSCPSAKRFVCVGTSTDQIEKEEVQTCLKASKSNLKSSESTVDAPSTSACPPCTPEKRPTIKFCIPKMDSSTDPPSYISDKTSLEQSKVSKTDTDTLDLSKPKTEISSTDERIMRDPQRFLQFVRESLGMSVEEFTELGFQEMFSRHMELTEYCHDRIKSLMNLIEQIRKEKRDICSPIDHSLTLTSYMDLPSTSNTNKKDSTDKEKLSENIQSCLQQDISNESSLSQDAIDSYLLGISKDSENKKSSPDRLKSGDDSSKYVSVLDGIPKYTQEESNQQKLATFLSDLLHQIKPRPPPSLLRSNMKGHTNEVPHELSTIAEMDTLLSSRNTTIRPDDKREPSPKKSPTKATKKEVGPKSPREQKLKSKVKRPSSPEEKVPSRDISPKLGRRPQSPEEKVPSRDISPRVSASGAKGAEQSNSSNMSDGYVTIPIDKTLDTSGVKGVISLTPSDISKSGISGIVSLSSDSSQNSDELEALLKKFKMEWAISLVKKTEQAMALSSSSSSDLLTKKDVSSDSLRLKFKDMSESERAKFVDLSNNFKEFHDISEIVGVVDRSKSQQRTSTPVQHSKSTESIKKSITNESFFKVDSELSSVKNSSDDNQSSNLFLSIPNLTLNTEHISLRKS